MNFLKVLFGCVCFIIAFNAQPAHAQLVTFADRTTFDGTFPSANVEGWDSNNNGLIIPNGTSLNGITYQTNSTNNALITQIYLPSSGSQTLGETGLGYFGPSDTVTFTFSHPLTAFGIDINTSTTFLTGDYTATLSNGAVIDSSYDPFPGYTTGEFIGVSDSVAFNSVTITDVSDNTDTLDTLRYVYASTPTQSVVPEPPTVGLMIIGLIGIAVFALRRKFVFVK